MEAIEDRLPDILSTLQPQHRPLMANAQLNLGVNHILAEAGAEATAVILHRLAD